MITITMESGEAGLSIEGERKDVLQTLLGLVKSNVVTPEFADRIIKLLDEQENQRESRKRKRK